MLQKPEHKGARRGGWRERKGSIPSTTLASSTCQGGARREPRAQQPIPPTCCPCLSLGASQRSPPAPHTHTTFYSSSLYPELLVISGVSSALGWLNCKPCRCPAWRLTNEPRDSDRDISGLLDKRILQT